MTTARSATEWAYCVSRTIPYTRYVLMNCFCCCCCWCCDWLARVTAAHERKEDKNKWRQKYTFTVMTMTMATTTLNENWVSKWHYEMTPHRKSVKFLSFSVDLFSILWGRRGGGNSVSATGIEFSHCDNTCTIRLTITSTDEFKREKLKRIVYEMRNATQSNHQ